MIVKKFVGDSFHEACQKIKDELGSDAMILQTNRVKVGGFLGFFGRWVFEVIAQASAPAAATSAPGNPAAMTAVAGAGAGAAGQNSGGQNSGGQNSGSWGPVNPGSGPAFAPMNPGSGPGGQYMHAPPHLAVVQPHAFNAALAQPPVGLVSPGADPGLHSLHQQGDMSMIRRELDDLKTKIDLLVTAQLSQRAQVAQSGVAANGWGQSAPQAPAPLPTGAAGLAADLRSGNVIEVLTPPSRNETLALREMMDLLSGSELEPGLRGQIKTHLLETTVPEDLENLRTLKDRVIDYLSRSLVANKGIEIARGATQKIVAVVGPTGVGKTTTLAKLGAGLKFNLNLEVGFLTLDTYRIAAPEQLKKYGEIIDVPVEVVFNPETLSDAIKAFADKDVILIDTAGRNSKNRADMVDLVRFLDCGVPVETYLVLSANTKYSDLVDILDNFKDLTPTNLILTKLDETSSFGSMISLLSRCKKGVSYVTTGQNVPEDIMPASPAKLARLLFERRLVA